MPAGTFLPPGLKGIEEVFDGVVDTSGSGTFATIQDADDALDAGDYALWVKQGTYAAGFTVSTDNAYIYMEPGTVVQAAITLSGDGVTLVLGAQCDIQGLITISGNNCSLYCQNGVNTDGILASGNFAYINGGGWETICDGGNANVGIDVPGTDCLVENISAKTTAGGSGDYSGMKLRGNRSSAFRCKVIDADANGLTSGGSIENRIIDCVVLGADGDGIALFGNRGITMGNYVFEAGDDGIVVGAGADNSIVMGNIVQDQASQSIELAAGADNCVVVGNRVDGAITDSSTGSVVASNDATTF